MTDPGFEPQTYHFRVRHPNHESWNVGNRPTCTTLGTALIWGCSCRNLMRSGTSSSGFSPAWPPDFGGLLDAAGGASSWSGVAGTPTFPSERTCNHRPNGIYYGSKRLVSVWCLI